MSKSQLADIWKETLKLLEKDISKPTFETWFQSTELIAYYDDYLIISTPNIYSKNWLQNRYIDLIKEKLETLLNHPVDLKFVTAQQKDNSLETIGEDKDDKFEPINNTHEDYTGNQLNPKYTFDTFVVGNSNRFAHAASLAVAESVAKAYNPLFIYGGVGLGKTHLMHAISHVITKNFPMLKLLYVTGEQFTNEMIDSIRYEKQVEFRNTYRKIDVLLIDDIQFLAGKEGTQEEFFHTFNALYEANKQIIISSDRPPKEIPTLEERLRSRFEWGLTTDINPPDYETRIAILRKKAQLENITVPDEINSFIATHIHTNIRELEGALSKITAYCMLTNQTITLELAEEILKDMIPQKNQKIITVEMIQQVVADQYKLNVHELKQKKRTRAVAFPRQVAMYLSRELTDLSLPQIGEKFGGRDHTTVLHAHDKISELRKNDPILEKSINEIIAKLKST